MILYIYIKLNKNTKAIYGNPAPGVIRNIGVQISTGEYICFLDDDDCFMPNKIEVQLREMISENAVFSSTDAYIGWGEYDKNKKYKTYNEEHFKNDRMGRLRNMKIYLDEYPKWIDLFLTQRENLIIHSTVMMHRSIFDKFKYNNKKPGDEDYQLWLTLLNEYKCLYINLPLIYYDDNHAGDHDGNH